MLSIPRRTLPEFGPHRLPQRILAGNPGRPRRLPASGGLVRPSRPRDRAAPPILGTAGGVPPPVHGLARVRRTCAALPTPAAAHVYADLTRTDASGFPPAAKWHHTIRMQDRAQQTKEAQQANQHPRCNKGTAAVERSWACDRTVCPSDEAPARRGKPGLCKRKRRRQGHPLCPTAHLRSRNSPAGQLQGSQAGQPEQRKRPGAKAKHRQRTRSLMRDKACVERHAKFSPL